MLPDDPMNISELLKVEPDHRNSPSPEPRILCHREDDEPVGGWMMEEDNCTCLWTHWIDQNGIQHSVVYIADSDCPERPHGRHRQYGETDGPRTV